MTMNQQEARQYPKVVLDQQKFIFQRCYSLLAQFGIPNPEEVAKDLTQDTIIRACASFSNFRGDAKLSSWLYRIATNIALDHLRRNRNHLQCMSLVAAGSLLPVYGNFSDPFIPKILESYFSTCTLSHQREIFDLYFTQGYAPDDIALRLGCTPGMVKSRVFRMRQALKARLTQMN